MIEREIQGYLFERWERQSAIALPNYAPRGWYESDLFAVTRAGYFREYEIKLTVSDFRADAKKGKKHQRLGQGYPDGPTQFTYVVPHGMLDDQYLPVWAGLIEIEKTGHGVICGTRKTRSPRLHSNKLRQSVIDHAFSVCYWRYWNERAERTTLIVEKIKEPAT